MLMQVEIKENLNWFLTLLYEGLLKLHFKHENVIKYS